MIHFKNVSKKYNINNKETIVLNNIDFTVHKSDIFGIVGNTGSGKSTILRLINGFIEPDDGSVFIMGEEVNSNIVKRTSTIFQNYNLLNNLNVIDNVLLPLKLRKTKMKNNEIRARELLNYVGLKGYEKQNIKTLSGGQMQRVAIARSLITNPEILLCDEPTSALDQNKSFEILKLLKKINKEYQTTIVIISHNIDVIKYTCNKVAILEDGEITNIITNKPKDVVAMSYKERLAND